MEKFFAFSVICLFLLVCLTPSLFAQSEIEEQILNEINVARTNPQIYIAYLEEHKKLFKGKKIDYGDYMIETSEGTAAVDETIQYLKKLPQLMPLKFSTILAKPAKRQLSDVLENPTLGHKGKDGSNLPKRMAEFGIESQGSSGENILRETSGSRRIVLTMIIDDSVKDRGHRKNIFDDKFKHVGIAYGDGKIFGTTVIVFSAGFTETEKKSSN